MAISKKFLGKTPAKPSEPWEKKQTARSLNKTLNQSATREAAGAKASNRASSRTSSRSLHKPLMTQSLADKPERVQKLLADYGLGSRREIETWIEAGRISVNKHLIKLGDKASLSDLIELDGKALKLFERISEKPRLILYHKAEGQICSRDSTETHESVFVNLPKLKTARWVMVGRLDIATSGLLLFTTSGELANKLMHPSAEIEREYACRIFAEDLTQEQIKAMKSGIMDQGELLKFESIRSQGGEGRNHWYHVIIKTGKNREVRRIFESQEVVVSRLIRVRFGDLFLPPRLKKKDYIELDVDRDLQFLKPVKKVPKKDLLKKDRK